MTEFISRSLEDTKLFAKDFAKNLKPGQTVLLFGEMGAGKTTFTKSVIQNLGFNGVVTSPTFTLVNQYKAKDFTIFHFDMYRLEDITEAFEIGLDEMLLDKNAIKIVEWPEKATDILPKDALKLSIKVLDDNTRSFCLEGEL